VSAGTENLPARALDLRAVSQKLAADRALALPQHPHLLEAAIGTWHGRMLNEYGSARVFDGLAEQMRAAELPETLASQVLEFGREERSHGAMCGAVVETLGGRAEGIIPSSYEFPWHRDAVTKRAGVLRNVLSICCLSETVAVALIGAERLEMPEGQLKDLLTTIWSDEVGHARFGWKLVGELAPSLTLDERADLNAYLRVAFGHLEEHELAHLPLASQPPKEGSELGLCSGADARTLFFRTVDEVIIAGLEKLGIEARAAWQARVTDHRAAPN
jgi:hypothetical protein